jgi:hypothetical protein
MDKGQQTWRRARFSLAFPFSFLPFAFLMVGCGEMKQLTAAGVDPLLGGPPLQPSALTKSQPQLSAPTSMPTAPANSLSNAALATAAPRPLDGSRDLRIGNPPTGPANDGWGRRGPPTPGNGSGAILRDPEPITEPAASPPARASSPATTFEQVKAQLTARGVVWQRLEMTGENGEWRFTCSVPNHQNAKLRRTYIATARDELSAMQAALDQIDRGQ